MFIIKYMCVSCGVRRVECHENRDYCLLAAASGQLS